MIGTLIICELAEMLFCPHINLDGYALFIPSLLMLCSIPCGILCICLLSLLLVFNWKSMCTNIFIFMMSHLLQTSGTGCAGIDHGLMTHQVIDFVLIHC